ncbi:MAG TPA: PSD1 and planctomycete cytochrome C domain-containing protein [Gemmataceae bacterium]|jgi:mono/diheme cytochrome c family protein|nr:PSD1 and planctomycete cytochrome C domain-containing protein [Gemmataceae bacterium]
MLKARLAAVAFVALACGPALRAAEPAASPEFFENKVRPVLIEHCFKCHGDSKGKEPKGGLRLDSRAALLKGGDNGPALVVGAPDKSKIIEAVRYQNADMQMPPKGKLSDAVIANLTAWVKAGAVWPGEAAGPAIGIAAFDLAKRKREHWAWRPVRAPDVPSVRDASWPASAVDRFILAKLEANKLRPALPAERRVWIRRVTFDLIGLPPTPAEIDAYLADTSVDAERTVVERLLASPHFGERWARHWLDLVRYAETRGHEFDPLIPNAYQYRDYVIRGLNADVPYDRFVQEQIAGDLLPKPRLHPKDGFNESVLGTGFWFLNEEVHSPVDIRQDQADRFDNRIDVLTKTFCALTVSCARCHDHKFDAISTRDYYALYGIIEGSSYRQVRFDTIEQNRRLGRELDELNAQSARASSAALRGKPLRAIPEWKVPPLPAGTEVVIDYSSCRPDQWLPDDASFGTRPRQIGDLIVEGGRVQFAERAAAVYDRLWSDAAVPPKTEADHGVLGARPRSGRSIRTPMFQVAGKLHYLVKGGGMAFAAVDGHTLVAGPLHGSLVMEFPNSTGYRWVTHDLSAYQGHHVHVEFTAGKEQEIAVAMVVQGSPAPPLPLLGKNVDADEHEVAATIERLAHGPPTTARDASIANALLEIGGSQEVKQATADYLTGRERIAKEIHKTSRLAPAAWEGSAVDERVFIRGSPKGLGEPVPRRFLEALAGNGAMTTEPGSGRLALAKTMTDREKNPFIARVMVNRVWHHLFGRGLVASVDNFGVLGEAPTHPELLDFLADRFVRDGWSTKNLIRDLVLSSTYRMSTLGDPESDKADVQNLLVHRMRIRRLEGEAIRDAMLAVSGRLDRASFGPPIPVHLTPFLEGRGKPGVSGPLDGDGRRSIYQSVRRNFLNPFFLAFDTPIPFSTVGRRQVSNVPAQALILLNDPFVQQQAALWAKDVLARPMMPPERIRSMYLTAFGRPPTNDESAACLEFIDEQAKRHGTKPDELKPWADLAHTLFNMKEFIYLD